MPVKVQPYTTYRTLLGQVLAHFREVRKLTQADLASRVGLSQSALSRIESGSTAPSVETARRAAEALDISATQLFDAADRAEADLKRRGIRVETEPPTSPIGVGVALIATTAVLAVVAAVLLIKKK